MKLMHLLQGISALFRYTKAKMNIKHPANNFAFFLSISLPSQIGICYTFSAPGKCNAMSKNTVPNSKSVDSDCDPPSPMWLSDKL